MTSVGAAVVPAAAVVPVACGWSDVGSWHAVWAKDLLERMGVEQSLTDLTRRFTALECPSAQGPAR
mgnify:CR=1 FL=1